MKDVEVGNVGFFTENNEELCDTVCEFVECVDLLDVGIKVVAEAVDIVDVVKDKRFNDSGKMVELEMLLIDVDADAIVVETEDDCV